MNRAGGTSDVPVFVAGDLCHTYSQPPELVNFALRSLPDGVHAVPGNHDLPNHSIAHSHRSCFYTLHAARGVKWIRDAGLINMLDGDYLLIRGFGHGEKFGHTDWPNPGPDSNGIRLAVVHRYVWAMGHSHPGALPEEKASRLMEAAGDNYDVVLTGDNHSHFYLYNTRVHLFNAGCLIRRRADERHLKPRIGLLYSDRSIETYTLNTSADVWRDNLEEMEADLRAAGFDPSAFLESIRTASDRPVEFGDRVERYMAETRCEPGVISRVRQIMDAVK